MISAADSAATLPLLSLKDETGQTIPLLSLEAYRAEFKYLRKVLHRVDLHGPAVKTDGWNYNIPEAEWPFMSYCYFGYACVNLAQADPVLRSEAFPQGHRPGPGRGAILTGEAAFPARHVRPRRGP
jgi:hypothetical protein